MYGIHRGEGLKSMSRSAVRSGIIKVRHSGRKRIAAQARIARLPVPVVSFGGDQTVKDMGNATLGCARPLVKVTRILV